MTIGKYGTFLTNDEAITSVIGQIPEATTTTSISISSEQAALLEEHLGLVPGSLEGENVLTIVDNVAARAPRSPLDGNEYFQGPGRGLPGGGTELVIDPIPSSGGPGIRQVNISVKDESDGGVNDATKVSGRTVPFMW